MARSFPTSAGLVLCWMFSPEALVMLGNSVGRGGRLFFTAFAIGVVLSTLAIMLIHHPAVTTTTGSSFAQLAEETGLFSAITLTLACYLCLVLLLPTGMLVTAGFTFNETFIYWFPNFAFSFLLLGIILSLHLAGRHVALAVQPFFIILTISCLVLLCLAGLYHPPELQPTQTEPGDRLSLMVPLIFTALLLFLGYDRQDSLSATESREYSLWALIGGFILLSLWAFVSLKHVPGATLANSTIPYIISAREILDQPGRIIMGVAVISGTCGVVNGLFLISGRSLQHMAESIFFPSIGRPALRQRICPVVFSVCIGIFMARGLAGSEKLETYIYGALLFWLLMIGTHCFAAARKLHKKKKTCTAYWYLLSAVFPVAVVWLACVNVHAITLVVFCFLVLAVSAIFSAGWILLGRKIHNKTIQDS